MRNSGGKLFVPWSLRKLSAALGDGLYIVGGYTRDYWLCERLRRYGRGVAGTENAPDASDANAAASGEKTYTGGPETDIVAADIDLAGPMSFLELKRELPVGFFAKLVNERTGTVLIVERRTGKKFEYTPFRTETYENGGHTPSAVEFSKSLEADALRRDFTCNAIYYSLHDGRFHDPLFGARDIAENRLRIATDKTLSDDGLRILRLARFAASTGLVPDGETMSAARENAVKLSEISKERIQKELELIFSFPHEKIMAALRVLAASGAFLYITGVGLDVDGLKLAAAFKERPIFGWLADTAIKKYADEGKTLRENIVTALSALPSAAGAILRDLKFPRKVKDETVGAFSVFASALTIQCVPAVVFENGAHVGRGGQTKQAVVISAGGEACGETVENEGLIRICLSEGYKYRDAVKGLLGAFEKCYGMYPERAELIERAYIDIETLDLPVSVKDMRFRSDDVTAFCAGKRRGTPKKSLHGKILEAVRRLAAITKTPNDTNALKALMEEYGEGIIETIEVEAKKAEEERIREEDGEVDMKV